MRKTRRGDAGAGRPAAGEESESEHETSRRIKIEQERYRRKQLSRFRGGDAEDDEFAGSPAPFVTTRLQ